MIDALHRAAHRMALSRISQGEDPDDTENALLDWLEAKGLTHRDASRIVNQTVMLAVAEVHDCAGGMYA